MINVIINTRMTLTYLGRILRSQQIAHCKGCGLSSPLNTVGDDKRKKEKLKNSQHIEYDDN
jgi:hypothetical protein